ncbi:MAG: hypothetical protein H7Z43_14555 [Clostridia bacterium]|nr:hypothetical protein [Deltaproteobacteria bacterium]
MANRSNLAAVFVSLALFACDDTPDGYYYWDETRDVWCYQYGNGSTECDTSTSCDNVYGYHCGDGNPTGDSDTDGPTDNNPDEPGDGGTTPTPPTTGNTSQCFDQADGKRKCVVIDGDYVCEFFYDAGGTVTGGNCVLIDSNGENSCSPGVDGGLICTFDDPDGTAGCIAIFDSHGIIEFDPCGYFQQENGDTISAN